MGILPGRAPIVGRLGAGSLRFTDGNTESVFFVDGGFLQVKGPVVSVLTNRSMTLAEIDVDAARASLTEALSQRPTTDEDFETRDRELDRARKMVALARKPR